MKTIASLVALSISLALPISLTARAAAEPTKPVSMVHASAPNVPERLGLHMGRGSLLRMPAPFGRVAVGDPKVLDFTTLSSTEVLLLGKSLGGTNLFVWDKSGKPSTIEVRVDADLEPLAVVLKKTLPLEKDIQLGMVAGSIILEGSVSDTLVADTALNLAQAFANNMVQQAAGGNKSVGLAGVTSGSGSGAGRVINLLRIRDPQQVMLEVRIAEISKNLLETLGVGNLKGTIAGASVTLNANIIGASTAAAMLISKGGFNAQLNAEKDDTLFKVLAEPTLVTMSGQEGSFLVGGKVLIPVSQSLGSTTLEERTYGVGLKFVPIVLDGGRINLKVAPEVSEIAKDTAKDASGNVLPSFKTSSVSTTVQLRDGQSLVIGGLLRNNITEAVKAFPVLGEIPILGALFRSSEFVANRTELVVMIKPSLVRALDKPVPLPTDEFVPPSRSEFFMDGHMEQPAKGAPDKGGV